MYNLLHIIKIPCSTENDKVSNRGKLIKKYYHNLAVTMIFLKLIHVLLVSFILSQRCTQWTSIKTTSPQVRSTSE